jgi:hypothetical protein
MTIGNYSTGALVRVVRDLRGPTPGFLLSTFFPNVMEYTTEEVGIDVIVGQRRIAPFVSPLVQGKLVAGAGFSTRTYKPPYIKDKRAPSLTRPMKRRAGERFGGEMSPAEREAANLAFEMDDQIGMVNRRLEWMAASALTNGSITVSGEGFDTAVISFGRDGDNDANLTSTARWGESGNSDKPSEDIETWSTQVLKSSGAGVTDIVFTPGSWKNFKADPNVADSIDTTKRGGTSSVDLGGGQTVGGRYVGTWGQYTLWLYQDWYIDPDTLTETDMVPDHSVILAAREAVEGVRSFGAIMDPEFNYGAMAYAPKTWVEKDPAQRIIMMQSAPLLIPTRPNATFCAQTRRS